MHQQWTFSMYDSNKIVCHFGMNKFIYFTWYCCEPRVIICCSQFTMYKNKCIASDKAEKQKQKQNNESNRKGEITMNSLHYFTIIQHFGFLYFIFIYFLWLSISFFHFLSFTLCHLCEFLKFVFPSRCMQINCKMISTTRDCDAWKSDDFIACAFPFRLAEREREKASHVWLKYYVRVHTSNNQCYISMGNL